ncbi:MAG: RsmE family RNA methyltransferase [Candidatus Saelkia tenebricola]|nr:RsmE family RNA methyltransferase [Candidatus Saelkia tenebricola]
MEKHYFYAPDLIIGQKSVDIITDDFYHLDKVLRLNVSQTVYMLNGKGVVSEGRILSKNKHFARVEITNSNQIKPSKNKIILLQALIKGMRMELLLEKAAELGISEIVPIITKNCVVKEVGSSKLKRWKKILIQAMKQSANSWLIELSSPIALDQALEKYGQREFSKIVLAINNKDMDLSNKINSNQVVLLVGPEGDFTEQEMLRVVEVGFKPLSLGGMRLRSETAAIAGITLLKYITG